MAVHPNIFFGIFYWVVVLLMVILISFTLFSLVKQGDERKEHIKTKAMSGAFVITVVILLIDILRTMYMMFTSHSGSAYPFVYLFLVLLSFLVLLVFNKRKYGD